MYTIRTYNGVVNDLRKFFIKNRNGIVIDSIKTKDLAEYVINMEICMIQSGIIGSNALNKPICIRRKQDTYVVIFIIKTKMENTFNEYKLPELGVGVYTFKNWFSRNIKKE